MRITYAKILVKPELHRILHRYAQQTGLKLYVVAKEFTSGANIGQGRRIRDYTGTGQDVFLDRPLTAAPADNDTFIILGIPTDHEANFDTSVRRVGWMVAKNINKVDASTTTVAIKKTDDTANQFTQTVSEDAGANPITILDTI